MAKKKTEEVQTTKEVDAAAEALELAKANKSEIEALSAQFKKAFETFDSTLTLLKERNRLR